LLCSHFQFRQAEMSYIVALMANPETEML